MFLCWGIGGVIEEDVEYQFMLMMILNRHWIEWIILRHTREFSRVISNHA